MTRAQTVRLALRMAIDTTEASIDAHHHNGEPMPEWSEQIEEERKILVAFKKELKRRTDA